MKAKIFIKPFSLFILGNLLTIVRAQIFEPNGYYELETGNSIQINNDEYPSGYPLQSARQKIIRTDTYSVIEAVCRVVVGQEDSDCTDFNGVYFLTDGTSYLNSTNHVQACNNQQIYRFRTLYNTFVVGHLSIFGDGAKTGAWICNVQAISSQRCDCGWRSTTRIVNGEVTAPNDYPSIATLIDDDKELRGAASILGGKALITAAHTITDANGQIRSDINRFHVDVGRYDITRDVWDDTVYSERYAITGISIHPLYNVNGETYDVAIIYTDRILPSNRHVGPICLPTPTTGNLTDYQAVTILGWGSVGFGEPYSEYLRAGKTNILPNNQCPGAENDLSIVCTRSQNARGGDSCQGDSGGPVQYFNSNINRWVLAGITSSGDGCGTTGYNQRIDDKMDFIRSQPIPLCLF